MLGQLRRKHVFVLCGAYPEQNALAENELIDWSFGNGEAQIA